MTEIQFVTYLARKIKTVGSQKELAKQLGVSPAFLSEVLRGGRKPSPKLLAALGLKKRPLEIDAV